MQPRGKHQHAAALTLLLLSSTLLAACQARPEPSNTAAQQPSQQQPQQQQKQQPEETRQQAATASKPDKAGRLWGQLNSGSSGSGGGSSSGSGSTAACAFKDAQGHALFYAGYEPGSWLHTPACRMTAFSANSVTDSKLRTWGWEQQSGSLCAFKDDQQLPIPQQQTYTMLSWSEAPACLEQPQPTADNAVPDKFGCLWGWQLNRNCAYRDAATGQPVYFSGYSGKCDVAGSVRRAAEWNASKEFARDPTPSGPGGVTGMGCIGQKRDSVAPGSSRAPCTETTVPVTFGPNSP